jgi:carbamate kinase
VRTKLLILIAFGGLAGCQNFQDPSTRTGTWKPEHTNETNLQAMIANPADLVLGHGDGSTGGTLAAAAIERLRADKVKPLPASGVAEIKLVNFGNGGGQ